MSTAVYIGAGLDTRPIVALKNIQTFVCIDSKGDTPFIQELVYKMECIGMFTDFASDPGCFSKRLKKSTCIIFKQKNGRCVYYYVNTTFPIEVDKNLLDCDNLIISGYTPHRCILDFMKKPLNLHLFEGTDNEEGTVTNHIIAVGFAQARIRECRVYHEEYRSHTVGTIMEANNESLSRFFERMG